MKKILSFFAAALVSLVSYASISVTYTVDKYSNELPSDAQDVTLKIYPVNFGENVDVMFVGDVATDITITNSQNEDLGGSSPVTNIVMPTTGNEFKVEFNNEQISNDIVASLANNISYMISFAAHSLEYTDGTTHYTNKYPVTAYLYFWEAVDFTVTGLTPVSGCGKDTKSATITVSAYGHNNENSSYDDLIELTEGATATISGISMNGDVVNEIATIAAVDGSTTTYTLTWVNDLPQTGDAPYEITIQEGAFKASQSTSKKIIVQGLSVFAHPVFHISDAEDMDPGKSFTLNMSVTPEIPIETIKIPLASVTNACTLATAESTIDATFTYANGVVTVTTAEDIVAGEYVVTFPEGSFSANVCTSPELTANLHVEDVVWNFQPNVVHINDATTEFEVTVAATFGGSSVAIDEQTISAKLDNGSEVELNLTSDAGGVYTYTAVLSTPIAYVEGKDETTPTEHLTIAAGSFKAMNSDNSDAVIGLLVDEYVIYSIDTKEILIDSKTTEYIINVVTKNGSGEVLERTLSSNVDPQATPAPSTHIALNGGFGSVYPTIEFPAANQMKVIFGEEMHAGNYQLNIPVDALYADANANDNKMFVNFRVMNHIDLSIDPASESVATGATTATIQITGYDSDDDQDATVNVKLADDAVVTIDGVAVASCDATENAGEYIVTFPALTEGSHVVAFAAGSVLANASKNETALGYTINAEDFSAEDVTINQNDTEFDVKVSEVAVTVLDGAVADVDGTEVTLTNATADGYVHVTMPAALAKGSYTLTINDGSIKGAYADLYEDLICNVEVINEFFFVDNNKPEITTTVADVEDAITAIGHDFDQISYSRNFTNTGVQQLCLPFSIDYDEIADDADLYRIAMIHYLTDADGELILNEGQKQLVIELKKMKSGDKTVANMPYVIKAKSEGIAHWTFANKSLVQPETKTLSMSTVFDTFTIKSTIEKTSKIADPEVEGAIICSGSSFKFNTQGGTIRAWSWYGVVGSGLTEGVGYVKVAIDGELFEDGEATGIATLFQNNSNDAIYNIAGQKLNKANKGVNIINGKKVLVK